MNEQEIKELARLYELAGLESENAELQRRIAQLEQGFGERPLARHSLSLLHRVAGFFSSRYAPAPSTQLASLETLKDFLESGGFPSEKAPDGQGRVVPYEALRYDPRRIALCKHPFLFVGVNFREIGTVCDKDSIHRLEICHMDEEREGELCGILAGFTRLEKLTFRSSRICDGVAHAVAGSEHAERITYLNLMPYYGDMGYHSNYYGCRIEQLGAQALAQSQHLRNLTMLNLWGNSIGGNGAQALAQSQHLRNLTMLNLGNNKIGPACAQVIAGSENMARLAQLNLENNGIKSLGAAAIAGSRYLTRLTRLELGGNSIGDAGAQAVANSEYMTLLTHLCLGYGWIHGDKSNCIGDAGAQSLARSRFMRNLTHLDLRGNWIGNEGAKAIARSRYLRGLEYLYLSVNNLGDDGVRCISRKLGHLKHLSLSNSGYLSDACKHALWKQFGDRIDL